ncbi:hypothetical protein BE21_43920 [Sorangium cellulosum]|uniref:Uncharacterized protein n=1 Tax=Sorangium cellulosum TaxID=56 RepID=A0A150TJW4_SORCE|nr:hypothetical protein BE21_43920 [Sorangium cellulosum]
MTLAPVGDDYRRSVRTPSDAAIDSYYRAAALGLRLLEAREARGRRFGEAAAATRRALGGALEDRNRLDLLLRDAAVSNPLAFSARGVFDLAWLTDDEPFGPSFPQAPAGLAAALLREVASPLAAADTPAVLVIASGARAVAMLAAHANARGDLDLGEQVLLVTDASAERQMFGFALLVTGSRGRPRVIPTAQASAARARALGVTRCDVPPLFRAVQCGEFPSANPNRKRAAIDKPTARAVADALKAIGSRTTAGSLKLGSLVLGSLAEEGPGYQDRVAKDERIPEIRRRARSYLVPQSPTAHHVLRPAGRSPTAYRAGGQQEHRRAWRRSRPIGSRGHLSRARIRLQLVQRRSADPRRVPGGVQKSSVIASSSGRARRGSVQRSAIKGRPRGIRG